MSERKRIIAIWCCLVLGAADLVYVNLQLVPLLGLSSPASASKTGESAREEPGSQPPARYKVKGSVSRRVPDPAPGTREATATPEASSPRQPPPAGREAAREMPAMPDQEPAGEQKPLKEAAIKKQQGPRLRAALVLYFSPGKWELDESHREELNELVEAIGKPGDLWVQIEGHTDRTTHSVLDNERLSEARADAVAGFWVENDIIGQDRIETLALGANKPVDPNNQPDAWAKNRRAVIRVFKGKP